MAADQLQTYREALETAREQLRIAEQTKAEFDTKGLILSQKLRQLRRVIDALEIQLGDAAKDL